MFGRKFFVVLILAANCLMSGPAIAASQCETYVSARHLLDSDVQPHVARIVGQDARLMGVYQPENNLKEAIIFTDQGEIRVYHLTNERWYDPQSRQFVCR